MLGYHTCNGSVSKHKLTRISTAGTYSIKAGLHNPDECTICPSGRYCNSVGVAEPSNLCQAGYFCEQGANSSNAIIDTMTPFGRQKSGLCPAGYSCWTGAQVPVPCPAGTYCAAGSPVPSPCPQGTYNMQEKQAACTACPAGYHCSPGGVIDFAAGIFYPSEGLHACADTGKGARAWMSLTGTPLHEIAGGVTKDPDGYTYVSGSVNATLNGPDVWRLRCLHNEVLQGWHTHVDIIRWRLGG